MKLTYKLVAAVLSVIIIAVIACAPLIYIGIQSATTQLLVTIAQAMGNDTAQEIVEQYGQIPDHIGIDISFIGLFDEDAKGTAEIIKIFSDGASTVSDNIKPLIAPLITFAVVLALLAVCAIVTAVLAFTAKDNRKVMYSSVAGIGLSLMAKQCFKAISTPFLDGEMTLSKLGGSSWLALIGEIDAVELSSVFWAVPAVFGLIILWTLLYNYTLPADEKKKRLVMIGEAE